MLHQHRSRGVWMLGIHGRKITIRSFNVWNLPSITSGLTPSGRTSQLNRHQHVFTVVLITHPCHDGKRQLFLSKMPSSLNPASLDSRRESFTSHWAVQTSTKSTDLLQPGGEAHVPEVVREEGPRTVGRVSGKQQPAEERNVFIPPLHAAVQLHRSAQHQQLERLQQPELLLSALEDSLAELLPLCCRGAVHRRPPLMDQNPPPKESDSKQSRHLRRLNASLLRL